MDLVGSPLHVEIDGPGIVLPAGGKAEVHDGSWSSRSSVSPEGAAAVTSRSTVSFASVAQTMTPLLE